MVQLGQKGRPFTTRLPYFMENVTTKSFGVGLERTFIAGFGLDTSLVGSDSTQVWWTRTRLEHFQMDSTRVTVPNSMGGLVPTLPFHKNLKYFFPNDKNFI